MVLGCVMCCEPLLWAKHPSQAMCRDSPRDHESYYGTLKSEESRARYRELVGIGRYQPMSTKCGHVFHKGCLKAFVAATPAPGPGVKTQCPVCLRPISYSQCFNVYFDAVSNASRRKDECQFKEIDGLELENGTLNVLIEQKRKEADDQYARLVEIQAQARITGEEMTRREEEVHMFTEYIESVGGRQNIKGKLNSVKQRFQALGMQNTHLAALIEEHAKAQARVKDGKGDEPLNVLNHKSNCGSVFQVPVSLSVKKLRVQEEERLQRRLIRSESEDTVVHNNPTEMKENDPDPNSYHELIKQRNSFRKIRQEESKTQESQRRRRQVVQLGP